MYSINEVNGIFIVENNSSSVLTPSGNEVITENLTLAKRLVKDLRKYGNDPSNPSSMVAFHYPYLDFHKTSTTAFSYDSVALGLEPDWEWTFDCPSTAPDFMMKWLTLFGTRKENYEKARNWVYQLTPIQLSAVTVLGRTLQSVNIPYIVINILEGKALKSYVSAISEFGYLPIYDITALQRIFGNYFFYYHLKIL